MKLIEPMDVLESKLLRKLIRMSSPPTAVTACLPFCTPCGQAVEKRQNERLRLAWQIGSGCVTYQQKAVVHHALLLQELCVLL